MLFKTSGKQSSVQHAAFTPQTNALPPAPSSGAAKLSVCLSCLLVWYASGLVVAVGCSLGLTLLQPVRAAPRNLAEGWRPLAFYDARWYASIAADGYVYNPKGRSNVAFFPVFPLTAHILAAASGLPVEAGLFIVSNVSLLAALTVMGFYVRARRQAESPPTDPLQAELADWAVLAAALFPTGCFFRLAYSESTFLLLAVLAMYSMVRNWPRWVIAALVGLGTAARPVGVALLAPLTIYICRGCGSRATLSRTVVRLAVYLPFACWGLAAFMAYQYCVFDDPLASVKAQEHWGAVSLAPWRDKAVALASFEPARMVYRPDSRAYWKSYAPQGSPWFSLQFANPLYFATAIALLACGAARRWLSLEEISLTAMLLTIPYVTRGYEMGMGSMGRFVSVAFPIYFAMARLLMSLPCPLRAALLAASGFFLTIYAALYAAGYAIF